MGVDGGGTEMRNSEKQVIVDTMRKVMQSWSVNNSAAVAVAVAFAANGWGGREGC